MFVRLTYSDIHCCTCCFLQKAESCFKKAKFCVRNPMHCKMQIVTHTDLTQRHGASLFIKTDLGPSPIQLFNTNAVTVLFWIKGTNVLIIWGDLSCCSSTVGCLTGTSVSMHKIDRWIRLGPVAVASSTRLVGVLTTHSLPLLLLVLSGPSRRRIGCGERHASTFPILQLPYFPFPIWRI